jgi:hypothetical protein
VVLSELLDRFRRARPPGAPAAAAGVPADQAAEREAELRTLFALLDEAEAEVTDIGLRATSDAEQVRLSAARQAARIVARVHERSSALRDAAVPDLDAEDDAKARAVLARAEAEAESIRERARARMPALVERMTGCVLAGPAEDGDAPGLGRR